MTSPSALPRTSAVFLRSIGGGALLGVVAIAAALTARMWGRENIEWQDRSWRLQENRAQVGVDNWSGLGLVLGGVGSAFRSSEAVRLSLIRVVGGSGVGSAAGVVGYMVWRYGVHQGRR